MTTPLARDVFVFPISFAQQRLWILDQLSSGNAAYHVPVVLRVTERLDLGALAWSLNEVVRRHEVLRTSFGVIDGQPVQVVVPRLKLAMRVVDMRGIPEPAREVQAQQLVLDEARQPFDLVRGPLLRACLLWLGKAEYTLLITLHHIVFDGWSRGVLVHELTVLYRARVQSQPMSLPELPIQYADYAAWQRAWLQDELLDGVGTTRQAQQLAYWRAQLADVPALELPTDRSRPPVPSYYGATVDFVLSRELTQELHALSQHEGVTLFMVLLACLNILLHRYTRQTDIAVGSVIANRTQVEVEGLIGCFVNTLVLRTSLAGNPIVRELLARVREVCLGAYAHQDLPFELLVKALQPERDLSRNPLFQVALLLQNVSSLEPAVPAPMFQLQGIASEAARFDLEFQVWDAEDGLHGRVTYSSDLFQRATIVRMLGHLQRLLEGIVNDPAQRLDDLPLLTDEERGQILTEWNATQSPYPVDTCLPDLLEAQVERTPDTVAMVFEAEHVTYAALHARANQLAHHLQALGVGPDVLTAVYMERSVDLVVGLLGILKAGGAYVPLDPTYPAERLVATLADSRAAVLLTHARLRVHPPVDWSARLKTAPTPTMLCLNEVQECLNGTCADNPKRRLMPEHLAYVIYTSGSTGRPKGVAITHQSTVAFLSWAREHFSLSELGGMLAATSVCFDLSIFELFAPLSWGGTIILAANALQLPDLPAATQVTLINSVPSALAELLRLRGIPHTVRTINLAGERLPARLLQQLYHLPNVQRVCNLYGPTEDTTYSTWIVLDRGEAGPVPIGRPLPNTQVYLLDEHFQLVPQGVVGELYLGGAGLARGYYNQPGLTAERFIPNPFVTIGNRDACAVVAERSSATGGRLYRTGDQARYRSDGVLEYLGRNDQQVKIRGFRIELGEIEAVMRQHPTVSDAIVLLREDLAGNPFLVAYLVGQLDQSNAGALLRPFLAERLPIYMLPTAFVLLDALPLMPNGKVDYKALPVPQLPRPDDPTRSVPPTSELERTIAAIWQAVLHVERVGAHDNFFDLGGHSLLLSEMHNKLQQALDIAIPLIELFKWPTVSLLAHYIDREHPERVALQQSYERANIRKQALRQQHQFRKRQTATTEPN